MPKPSTIPKASKTPYGDVTVKVPGFKKKAIDLDVALTQLAAYKSLSNDIWAIDPFITPAPAKRKPKANDTSRKARDGYTPTPGDIPARAFLATLTPLPKVIERNRGHYYGISHELPHVEPRSQKAKGVRLLSEGSIDSPGGLTSPFVSGLLPQDAWKFGPRSDMTPHHWVECSADWPFVDRNGLSLPALFARPCPTRPRHGFVESRVVRSYEDIEKVYLETLAQDPDGELILMPVLTGKYSGVASNAGVAYGLGNDGVTGGGKGIFIPAPATPNKIMRVGFYSYLSTPECSQRHGISQSPYLELVEDNGSLVLVQLRDGPEQPTTQDYIPRGEVITKVLTPNILTDIEWGDHPDLLEWETRIQAEVKANNGPQGLCVSLPDASLAAHAAVHAIQLQVAVVTSRPVAMGEDLVRVTDTVQPLTQADCLRLRDWLAHYAKPRTEAPSRYNSALLAPGVVHASSLWGNDDHLLALRALGVTELARLFIAAAAGECRHWWNNGPGRGYSNHNGALARPIATPLVMLGKKYGREVQYSNYLDRDLVYETAFNVPWESLHSLALRLRRDFRTSGWKVRNSYGGLKWAEIAQAGADIVEAINMFAQSPKASEWSRVIWAANKGLALAHNSGKVLTKWVGTAFLDNVAQVPLLAFLNPAAAECVLYGKASHNASFSILLASERISCNEPPQKEQSNSSIDGPGDRRQWSTITDEQVANDDKTNGSYWVEGRRSHRTDDKRPNVRRDARAYHNDTSSDAVSRGT